MRERMVRFGCDLALTLFNEFQFSQKTPSQSAGVFILDGYERVWQRFLKT
jgi:hypothetical protein